MHTRLRRDRVSYRGEGELPYVQAQAIRTPSTADWLGSAAPVVQWTLA